MLKLFRILSGALILHSFLCSLVLAQAPEPRDLLQDTINIRVNNTDLQVTFTLAAGQAVYYEDLLDCGTAGHKTSPPAPGIGRFYAHVHVNYSLGANGISGTDQTGAARTITEANIKAYWDNHYSGYTSEGAENIAQNCHSYALSQSTWVQKTAFIDADELQAASGWSDTMVLREGDAHSIFISEYKNGYIIDTVKSKERNNQSRIYKNTWTTSNPKGATTKMKKK